MKQFPIELDIDDLKASENITGFAHVDQTRIDYLLHSEVVRSENTTSHTNGLVIHNDLKSDRVDNAPSLPPKLDNREREVFQELPPHVSNSGAGGGLGDVELLSLISGIKDLFPELGEGFIEACLNVSVALQCANDHLTLYVTGIQFQFGTSDRRAVLGQHQRSLEIVAQNPYSRPIRSYTRKQFKFKHSTRTRSDQRPQEHLRW